MKCYESKRRLDPYLDGELTVAENLQVLEHLQLCTACQGVFESEKTARAALRRAQHGVHAPAGLGDRLFVDLERVPSALPATAPPAVRRRRLLFVVAAAAMFLVFGSLLTAPAPSFEALAGPVSERHLVQRYACGEESAPTACCCCEGCTPDVPGRVSAFFSRLGRRDFCGHFDLQERLGYASLGVAAWRFRGELVCWSTWRAPNGETVSHALVPSSERSARAGTADGRPVLLEPRGDGLACVFVFSSAGELRRFIEKTGLPLPKE